MAQLSDTATQSSPGSRLIGVDAARGVALLGMMAVHALWVYDAQGNPTTVFSLATGRSAALFAVLAGAGIAFTTRRAPVRGATEGKGTVAALAARALAIGAIGLALGWTSASIAAVILPYYAILFVLAIPLVFLRTRALVAVGITSAVAIPVLSQLVRGDLPAPRLTNPSFGYLFTDPGGLLTELALTGYYPAVPWVAYLCAGLVIGRLSLSSARVAGRLLAGGIALAMTAAATSWLLLGPVGGRAQLGAGGHAGHIHLDSGGQVNIANVLAFGANGTTPTNTWWWLAVDAPHSTTPLDLLHTIGTSAAVLGAMLLLAHLSHSLVKGLLWSLGAAGAMTLTLYTTHVMFMNSPLDVFNATTGYIVQVVVALVFAVVWRTAVGRGPLEGLVTALSQQVRARWPRTEPTEPTDQPTSSENDSRTDTPPVGRAGGV